MINKKQVSDALALSCVEYYFLAWLAQYYSVEKLYVESFVSLKKVFDDFSCGGKYETYGGIPRMQDVAERCGVTEHTFENISAECALKSIKNQSETELCLVRVNDTFFSEYKRKAWREDHYICVGNELDWINEYPLSDGKMDSNIFKQVYDGAMCTYRLKDIHKEPTNDIYTKLRYQEFDNINPYIGLDNFENALGVLRVSRKRLLKLYEWNIGISAILRDENALLDKLYLCVHYLKIRSNNDDNAVYGKIKNLIQMEQTIKELLK